MDASGPESPPASIQPHPHYSEVAAQPSDYSQTLIWMHDTWIGMMHEKFRIEAEKMQRSGRVPAART